MRWPKLAADAYQGPIGHAVERLTPETEADPVAVLVDLLVAFGSAVGAGPHVRIGGDEHPPRLFALLVGRTARARKGTAWSLVRWLMQHVDRDWSVHRVQSGFGSGESLVDAVRDATDNDKGPGDHRLLVREGELLRILRVLGRDGSTLSPNLRDAWDGIPLAARVKGSRLVASRPHVSVLADVTLRELRQELQPLDIANGLGNRFLFSLSRRAQRLPSGGDLDDETIRALADPLRTALLEARMMTRVHRSADAEAAWETLYWAIDDDVDGPVGALTARSEPYITRLALCYALADSRRTIELEHLRAATAVWDYSAASVAYIFGPIAGHPVAQRLYDRIAAAGEQGLDFTQQNDTFKGRVTSSHLAEARALLERYGLIKTVPQPTGGRPRTISFATEKGEQGEQRSAADLATPLLPLLPLYPNGQHARTDHERARARAAAAES